MQLLFPKTFQSWWRQIKAASVSAEYQQWRHRFTLKRLHLIVWVAIVALLIGALIRLTIFFPLLDANSPDYGGPNYDFFKQHRWLYFLNLIIQLLGLLFSLVLLKVPFARRYPMLFFLWFSLSLLVSGQVIEIIFLRQIYLDHNDWIALFLAQAILIPVWWQWHLLSQAMVLGQYAISHFGFGLRDPSVEYAIVYFDGVSGTVIICSIANLGVFLYERLLQQEFELRRQLRLFLYTVSHDLRNPVLGTIFVLKSLCNASVEKAVVSQELLTQMLESSDRQLKLIDSLLEAYTTETRGIKLRPRPVSLEVLVKSVITEMQPFLEREKATVTELIPAKLPLVNIDPLQVRRVYENLTANALEHNRSGLHLTFKVEGNTCIPSNKDLPDRWIYCTVSDDGEGIGRQQIPKVFDLYTRASSKKQSLNVGLGLYICRQIITAHGGEIGVNSSRRGASFWFTLPIAE